MPPPYFLAFPFILLKVSDEPLWYFDKFQQSEVENSYIVDNIRDDDLFVSHASADNYTSIANSYNFGKDKFNPTTNAKVIILFSILPSAVFIPFISIIEDTIFDFTTISFFNQLGNSVFTIIRVINFIVSKSFFLIRCFIIPILFQKPTFLSLIIYLH